MSGDLVDESDLRAIPELKSLQILDEDHPAARLLASPASANVIAEAANTVRLFELLRRDEYLAIAAVRFRMENSPDIRVYFQLRQATNDTGRDFSELNKSQ